MRKLAVFDLNNILFRSAHAFKRLSYRGQLTGGGYGFIRAYFKALDVTEATAVLVVTDGPPYIRQELFPEFKGNRKNDDVIKEVRKQGLEIITQFLRVQGVDIRRVKGLEADDLMALAALENSKYFDRVYLVSSDDDLNQLLTMDWVRLYKPHKTPPLYDRKEFALEHAYMGTPEKWLLASAIAGTHNGIPGIPKVGLKTAAKLIDTPVLYDKVLAKNPDMDGIIERNLQLIELPIRDTPALRNIVRQTTEVALNITKIARFLVRYGIEFNSSFRETLERINTRNTPPTTQ